MKDWAKATHDHFHAWVSSGADPEIELGGGGGDEVHETSSCLCHSHQNIPTFSACALLLSSVCVRYTCSMKHSSLLDLVVTPLSETNNYGRTLCMLRRFSHSG